jgi:hypothetical protein
MFRRLMNDDLFRALSAVGQSLSLTHAAELSKDGKIFNFKLRYFTPLSFLALPTKDISRLNTELA